MKKVTRISHESKTYVLEIHGWHNYLRGDGVDALYEIFTDDIRLSEKVTVGEYKAAQIKAYHSLTRKPEMTVSKFLRVSFKEETGQEWDNVITRLKEKINDSAIPYLLRKKENSSVDERSYALLKAASNGHVASMYFIGTALRDGNDANCLTWLSMAHNRGHVGASYDIAAFLDGVGNKLDSLRCLIISADSGSDLAYMSIFHIDILMSFLRIQDTVSLDNMLDELMAKSHNSCARYFKSIRLLSDSVPLDGFNLLKEFSKSPKKKPKEKLIDETYQKQLDFTQEFIDAISIGIELGNNPIGSIISISKEFSDISRFEKGKPAATSFADFDKTCILVCKELIERTMS